MTDARIRKALIARFPEKYVDELLECFREQRRNLLLGNLRPNEVEGGRFAEAAFRLLEHYVGWTVTPLGKQVDTEGLIKKLQNILTSAGVPDSVRLHIPRTLRVIYDIRSKRDAVHLADGIDPNLQDSTFVGGALAWVLAELVRIAKGVRPEEAFALVRNITVRRIPAVEDFHGFLKTLRPSLGPGDRILLLLYHRAEQGAGVQELSNSLKPSQRKNAKRALHNLEHEKDLVVNLNGTFKITRRGIQEIERRGLIELE